MNYNRLNQIFWSFAAVFVFLFLIYSPTLYLLIRPIPLYWFIVLFGGLILVSRHKINRYLLLYIMISLFLFLYLSMSGLIAGQMDNALLAHMISAITYACLMYYSVCPWVQKVWRENSCQALFKVYCYATIVHSLLVLFFFIFPEMRISLHPYLYMSDFGIERLASQWRGLGLVAQSGEAVAVSHGLAFFMWIRLFINKQIDILKAATGLLIMLAAIATLNRTGLVIGFIGLAAAVIFPGLRSTRKLTAVIMLSAILGASVLAIVTIEPYGGSRAINRTLEAFKTYEEEGRFATRSSDAIFGRMMFLPDVPVLTGTGNYGRQEKLEYVPSDVGYVRLYHGGGVLVIALWLCIPLFFLFASKKAGREIMAYGAFLSIVWLLANIKVLWLIPPGGPAVAVGMLIFMFKTKKLCHRDHITAQRKPFLHHFKPA